MTRRRRAAGRAKNNYIWTAVEVDREMNGVATADLIVADSDWSVTGGQRSATLLAIRGWLGFHSAGIVEAIGHMAIMLQDEDNATIPDPDAIGTYVDESILWTGGCVKSAGAEEARMLNYMEINVKAKRKIISGTNVILAVSGAPASEFRVVGILRGLLLLNA